MLSRHILRAVAVVLLIPPARAAPPSPESAVVIPLELLVSMRQYLGSRPYDEVRALVDKLEGCYRANTGGGSNGCASVEKANRDRKAALEAARAGGAATALFTKRVAQ